MLIYVNFMTIYVKIIKKFSIYVNLCKNHLKKNVFYQTDRQTHVQLKTIVRDLTTSVASNINCEFHFK